MREAILVLCWPALRPLIEAILDYIDANRPISGKNINVSDSPAGGRAIDAKFNLPAAAKSPLSPYAIDNTHVGVTWGTINGQQPSGFSAGGDPPKSLAVSGSGYIYASAVADTDKLTWGSPDVTSESDSAKANSKTKAWKMIGSYSTTNGVLTVITAQAGNVTFDFCDLAADV